MQIIRNTIQTMVGPREWFSGAVYVDTIAAPSGLSRLSASSVHFTPAHPLGQMVYVTEGVGQCQRRGEPIEVIRPGDRVFFESDEEQWHGAAPDRFLTHLAMQKAGADGNAATWGEHVTDEEYGQHRW
jgi:quercetin dioxygenase-like cupin family protein